MRCLQKERENGGKAPERWQQVRAHSGMLRVVFSQYELCSDNEMVCAGDALRAWVLSALVVHGAVAGNPDAKRLYDDLLSNYNKLVRPVVNTSDVLRVCIKLKLSQLIDVVSPKNT